MAKAATVNGRTGARIARRLSSNGRRNGGRAAASAPARKRRRAVIPPKSYVGSILPNEPIPQPIVQAIQTMEREVKMPVWMAVHDLTGRTAAMFTTWHVQEYHRQRKDLPSGKPVAILLHSPGGYASCAYQLATMLRRYCGRFSVIVPRYAKSAATLFALGATQVFLGECAELGPLDAQYDDPDKEEHTSALDEVQSLQRLHAGALSALDETMFMLKERTGKKAHSLLPHAVQFASNFMRPLLENLDPIHYTQRSRDLKVAEEYAARLLKTKYGTDGAKLVARTLVEAYPEHSFVIDSEEAASIGFQTVTPSEAMQQAIDSFVDNIGDTIIIGRLVEVKS